MTSPTWETFCCSVSDYHPSIDERVHFRSVPFSIVSGISASLGILGAVYQILPSGQPDVGRSALSGQRQRHIIKWLAAADLLACIGVLCRSALWLSSNKPGEELPSLTGGNPICALISAFTQYFYTATYMWTICYAADVYLTVRENAWRPGFYHLVSWGIPFVVVGTGLAVLYVPHLKCHSSMERVLVHYSLSCISLVSPMIINPVLYKLASQQVRYILQSRLAHYTDRERRMIGTLQAKFFHIVLVFYVCWFPNLLNCIVVWSTWPNLPSLFLIGLWYFMAVVNSLQAVLNSLVYTKGWSGCRRFCQSVCVAFKSDVIVGVAPEQSMTVEETRCEEGNERELLVASM